MECKNIKKQKQNFQRGKCKFKLHISKLCFNAWILFFQMSCISDYYIVCWKRCPAVPCIIFLTAKEAEKFLNWVIKILTTLISNVSLCILRTTSYWTVTCKRWQITVGKILSATILILFSFAAATLIFKTWSCIARREDTDLKAYSCHSLWPSTLKVHLQADRADMKALLSRK